MGVEGRRNRNLRCHKELKMFCSAIKQVYGPTKPRTTPLLSADGSTLLEEKSSITTRWREHFSTLLNRPSTVDPSVLDLIQQKPVITSLDSPLTQKLKVYRAVVLTSLLYGCETWTLYRRHLKQLELFHMGSLRTILNKWQDRVSNLQVLDMAEVTSIEAMILNSRLRWVGHAIRMEENRLPKQMIFGELASGKRKQGRPSRDSKSV